MADVEWLGAARRGGDWPGPADAEGQGSAWPGPDRHGLDWLTWTGLDRRGRDRQGLADVDGMGDARTDWDRPTRRIHQTKKSGPTPARKLNTERIEMAKKAESSVDIQVMEVSRGMIEFLILGQTPMVCNAMSAKVKKDLLMPKGRKNAAEKAGSLKHDPVSEFRASLYKSTGNNAETRIVAPATAFKAALMGAALDFPGATKSQTGRLCYVEDTYIPIYGIPQLMMSVVRSADMNKTPDVRTRAILPEWACRIKVSYTRPIMREAVIVNLVAAAGLTQGIGDWRIQKGSGNFGGYALVGADDPTWNRIIETGGREAQDSAIASPICYDSETEELLSWYDAETIRRGFKEAA